MSHEALSLSCTYICTCIERESKRDEVEEGRRDKMALLVLLLPPSLNSESICHTIHLLVLLHIFFPASSLFILSFLSDHGSSIRKLVNVTFFFFCCCFFGFSDYVSWFGVAGSIIDPCWRAERF